MDTNRIEGTWAHAKTHFRTINGTSKGNFEAHLSEIMWRSHEKGKNIYKSIFDLIRNYYTLDGPCNLIYPSPLFDTCDPDTRAAPSNTTVRRCSSDDEEQDVEIPGSQNMLMESDDGHITMPLSLAMSTPILPAHSSPMGSICHRAFPRMSQYEGKKIYLIHKMLTVPHLLHQLLMKHAGFFFCQIIPVKKENQEKSET